MGLTTWRWPPALFPARREYRVERTNVVLHLDVLQRKVTLGKRVAIIGAGGIGFDVAEFLLHDPGVALPVSIEHWCSEWGVDLQATANGGLVSTQPAEPYRELFLLQRKATRFVRAWVKRQAGCTAPVSQCNGVEMLAGVEYQNIDDSGLHIAVNGTSRLLRDDVVL